MRKIRTNVSMPMPLYEKIMSCKWENETVSDFITRIMRDRISDEDAKFFEQSGMLKDFLETYLQTLKDKE